MEIAEPWRSGRKSVRAQECVGVIKGVLLALLASPGSWAQWTAATATPTPLSLTEAAAAG